MEDAAGDGCVFHRELFGETKKYKRKKFSNIDILV